MVYGVEWCIADAEVERISVSISLERLVDRITLSEMGDDDAIIIA